MREQDFEFLYKLEERFWWFVAMRTITDTIVADALQGRRQTILDAGCGTGYNVSHYEQAGHSVFALDVASDAIAGVRQRGLRKVCQASVTEIPYRSSAFDFVFSFDVLGQVTVEQADKAIREMYRVLKPGGGLFVRVAAFEWLRSSHDQELHTIHRYTSPELRGKLQNAGFQVQLATYANSFLVPVVLLRRSLKSVGIGRGTDVKPMPSALGWLDPIFRNVLSAEARILGAGKRLPFGLSVICYARKA
jgi:ubiquinone/menaquinone biosynthesis C-methylase UbiE